MRPKLPGICFALLCSTGGDVFPCSNGEKWLATSTLLVGTNKVC